VSDIDPLHLGYLRNRFADYATVDVAELDLENERHFEPYRETFDTVVCLNVLEHVERDERALANLYSVLKPGARAIVLVPRGMWLYGSLDRVLDHCRRYSRTELAGKCQAAGFEIERIFSFNRIGLWPWFLNGRILRRRSFGRLQLKIYDSMIWLWRRLDRCLPWSGLSLIAIARKPDTPT